MKRTISLIIFVVIAAAIIAWGSWYANKMSQSETAAEVAQSQETQPVDQTQQTSTSTSSTSTMDNLQITDLTIGTGTVAQVGDTVTVNYVGKLDDGTTFDASANHGQPFSFLLGTGQVIKGWDEGVVGMKVGGTRELVIPPDLGYGASGAGTTIPPNATLHFTIELLSVSTSSPSGQ